MDMTVVDEYSQMLYPTSDCHNGLLVFLSSGLPSTFSKIQRQSLILHPGIYGYASPVIFLAWSNTPCFALNLFSFEQNIKGWVCAQVKVQKPNILFGITILTNAQTWWECESRELRSVPTSSTFEMMLESARASPWGYSLLLLNLGLIRNEGELRLLSTWRFHDHAPLILAPLNFPVFFENCQIYYPCTRCRSLAHRNYKQWYARPKIIQAETMSY